MSDLLYREYRATDGAWRLIPHWGIGRWQRRAVKRIEPGDVPDNILHDIGLSDVRRLPPRGLRD